MISRMISDRRTYWLWNVSRDLMTASMGRYYSLLIYLKIMEKALSRY